MRCRVFLVNRWILDGPQLIAAKRNLGEVPIIVISTFIHTPKVLRTPGITRGRFSHLTEYTIGSRTPTESERRVERERAEAVTGNINRMEI